MSLSKKRRKKFKFKEHVGPTIVTEVARRLKARGILAKAGTEHVYGEISGEDKHDAAGRMNRAARFRLVRNPEYDLEEKR